MIKTKPRRDARNNDKMTSENQDNGEKAEGRTIAGGGISGIVTNQQRNQFACARVAWRRRKNAT